MNTSQFLRNGLNRQFYRVFLNLYIKQKTCLSNHIVVSEFLGVGLQLRLWVGLKRSKSQS